MPLTNTSIHYGAITKSLHWLTALLILTLIPLGIFANDLPYDSSEALTRKAWFFSLHKTLGVTVFFVALARILWAISQPKPAGMHPDRKLETLAAKAVHWLLYGSLLLVPLSGWAHHAATSGFAPIWWPFGQNLPLVPKSDALAATTAGLHIVFERVLAASILLHLAGALKHHFIDRDPTLRRMLPGVPDVPNVAKTPGSVLPVAVAIMVWIGALGVGSMLNIYEKHDNSVQAAALQAVQSDWVVEQGTLDITVSQLGSPVTGSFADWTADIRFDETIHSGPAGSVEIVIATGSLTLGSVTTQALDPEYFNAEGFPTATYTAEIDRSEAGYTATGTLTIKDQSMPVSFPFALEVTEGAASMQATTTLDRRDYDIGGTQQDEGTLGFAVEVTISLIAQEGA